MHLMPYSPTCSHNFFRYFFIRAKFCFLQIQGDPKFESESNDIQRLNEH